MVTATTLYILYIFKFYYTKQMQTKQAVFCGYVLQLYLYIKRELFKFYIITILAIIYILLYNMRAQVPSTLI